jgi:hypothetical protein
MRYHDSIYGVQQDGAFVIYRSNSRRLIGMTATAVAAIMLALFHIVAFARPDFLAPTGILIPLCLLLDGVFIVCLAPRPRLGEPVCIDSHGFVAIGSQRWAYSLMPRADAYSFSILGRPGYGVELRVGNRLILLSAGRDLAAATRLADEFNSWATTNIFVPEGVPGLVLPEKSGASKLMLALMVTALAYVVFGTHHTYLARPITFGIVPLALLCCYVLLAFFILRHRHIDGATSSANVRRFHSVVVFFRSCAFAAGALLVLYSATYLQVRLVPGAESENWEPLRLTRSVPKGCGNIALTHVAGTNAIDEMCVSNSPGYWADAIGLDVRVRHNKFGLQVVDVDRALPPYDNRVRRRIYSFLTFSDLRTKSAFSDAMLELTPSGDGETMNARVLQTSGDAFWDAALLRAVSRIDPFPGTALPSTLRVAIPPPENLSDNSFAYGQMIREASDIRALSTESVNYSTVVYGVPSRCNSVKPTFRPLSVSSSTSGEVSYEIDFDERGRASHVHLLSSSSDIDSTRSAILAAYTTFCTPVDASHALPGKPWKSTQTMTFQN